MYLIRLLPLQVYLKINLSQKCHNGNMGSTASFEVSCGFVLRKGTFKVLRAVKVEKLSFLVVFFFFLL